MGCSISGGLLRGESLPARAAKGWCGARLRRAGPAKSLCPQVSNEKGFHSALIVNATPRSCGDHFGGDPLRLAEARGN